MQNNNLCILNNKSHTYLNPFTGSYSAIDLTLCDPVSYMDYGWKVHGDLCVSDHFPILLEILWPLYGERLPHWKLNKANWEVFETLCEQKLFQDPNTTDQTKYFMEALISIINKSMAKTSTSNKHNTPWFNNDCRSHLDYGIFIYRSARKSYLKKLGPIHHRGLRLILGAFRTSPVVSLYTEAHEAPLQLQCEKFLSSITQNWNPAHPIQPTTASSTLNTNSLNEKKKNHQTICALGGTYSPRICNFCYIKASYRKYHFGSLKKTQIILKLNKILKTKTHPSTYLEKSHTILLHHPDHQCIFTDGSKDSNKTLCATVPNKTFHKKALPMKRSIFTAEVCAIDLALNIISENRHNKFIIFSDSFSVLTSLNQKLENLLIVKLLSRLDSMSSHKEIMCWISSHIKGNRNERADSAAKSAIDLSPDNIFIPYFELKCQINKFFLTKWQQH